MVIMIMVMILVLMIIIMILILTMMTHKSEPLPGPLLRTNSKKSFKISEKGKVFQMSGEINDSHVPTNVLRIYGSVGLDS